MQNGLPMEPKKGKVKININAIVSLVLVVAIVLVLFFIIKDIRAKKNAPPTEIRIVEGETSQYYASVSNEPTQTPKPPLRPVSAGEGLLPIFERAYTDENEISLTFSGAISDAQMQKLLASAAENGAYLTFFPTGQALESNTELWNQVSLMGHEIESSGYTGGTIYAMSEEKMTQEIDGAIRALKDNILSEYELHFIKTSTFYDDEYVSLHRLLSSRGVYGIARQSTQLSTLTQEDIVPGAIINMEITGSNDLNDIIRLISYLTQQGFKLVTLNDLFDYGPNYLSTPETE